MTLSLWLDTQPEKKKEEFDLLVVGAGITGAACAYLLSQKKDLKVAVLDSGPVAASASGRNGGFIFRGVMAYYNMAVRRYGRDTARWILELNESTQAQILAFAEKYGNSFDLEKCGSYLLAASLEELQDLAESAELMKEDGFDLEYMKEDPIDRGFYGAIHNKGDLGVNPYLLVKALLSQSTAQVYENQQVFQIAWKNHQPLLLTQDYKFSAGRVLLCTNAFLPGLVPELANFVRPVRGQIIVSRPIEERILDKLCYANFGYEYFRQLKCGRFLLGGCREPFISEEGSYADALSTNVQNALQAYLKDRFPELAGVSIDYRWSGVEAFTRDGLPVIGELDDKPGVVFASGLNGHGLGYSLSLARVLIDYALDGINPGVFDSRRFKEEAADLA